MSIQECEGKGVSVVLHVVNLLCARKERSEERDTDGIIRDTTHRVKYPQT